MNENIRKSLNDYLANSDPKYAVMITGNWGCGKTHFIGKWLESYSEPDNGEDIITLKPILVSLYGLSEVRQITEAINRQLYPIIYSKGAKWVKTFINILGKAVLRTDLDFDGDKKTDAAVSVSLDSLLLFQSDSDKISGTKFLVFDDLERCYIEPKLLLGYINFFVERCNCHVVVVGDEEKLSEDYKAQLILFKEKTIGRVFRLQSNVREAVDYFLNEDLPVSDWLRGQGDTIMSTFQATQSENLRILRQCLFDFNNQFQQLDNELVNKDTYVLKQLLATFIVVYCEYKGTNYELMKNWQHSYDSVLMLGASDDIKQAISHLQQKYAVLNDSLACDVLQPRYISLIVRQIEEGCAMKDEIEKALLDSQGSASVLDKLAYFYHLSNEEFNEATQQLKENLLCDNIADLYQFGRSLAMIISFQDKGMIAIESSFVNCMKAKIVQQFSSIQDKNLLYKSRYLFVEGLYSFASCLQTDMGQDIFNDFDNQFQLIANHLSSEMDKALRNLNDDNVGTMVDLDNKPMPDGHSTYALSSIFAHIDAHAFFERIQGLSNAGRKRFADFLYFHYRIGVAIGSADCFAHDHECLATLRGLIAKKCEETQSVEKWSYSNLLPLIDAGIQRSKGDKGNLIGNNDY